MVDVQLLVVRVHFIREAFQSKLLSAGFNLKSVVAVLLLNKYICICRDV